MGLFSNPRVASLIFLLITLFVTISSNIDPISLTEEKATVKVRQRRETKPKAAASVENEEDDNKKYPDPFPLSIEWANFVKRTDEISEHLKQKIDKLVEIFSDKNSNFVSNKTGFLSTFPTGFINEFKPLANIFLPLQEQLDLNKAYTVFDPAVGLETIEKCTALAKANPKENIDKGRLKWIEVNAMAATLHHIFNKLPPELEQYGLVEVDEALQILYPSWTARASRNETGNTYQDLEAQKMVDYIDTEMNSLGDENHLIRILEKLLHKQLGLKGWDPSATNLNKYCYGNNIFGLIHDKFDVLIDAAQYLVMSDMKYAILQVSSQVYKAYQAQNSGGEDVKLKPIFGEIMENMTIRIGKKIKFSKLAENSAEVVLVPGPTVFRCDPFPEGCDSRVPKVTAPNCPQGVYVQNWTVYENGKALTMPKNISEPLKGSDGSPIACIALERVALCSNGSILNCKISDQICIDPSGNETDEPYTIHVIPVLIDSNGVPHHRDDITETFPEKGQWGKFDCSKDPDHPISPPSGPGRTLPGKTLGEPGSHPGKVPGEPGTHPGKIPGVSGTHPGKIPGEPGTLPGEIPGKPGTHPGMIPGEPGIDPSIILPPADWNCTVGPNDKGVGYIDCRPPGLSDANTAEFTLAFPGYLESELVLNHEGKCLGTCRDYKNPTPTCTNKTTHCDLYRKSHCEDRETDCMKQSQCPNKAKRCVRTSREVTFCPSTPGSGRVYDWYTIDGVAHKASSWREGVAEDTIDITKCSTDKIMKAKERWEMEEGVILNTPQYCELCMCVCADPILPEGRHFFDIGQILADTANGFAVSGLRFERKNNTMFLNIQQGTVLPNGKVDPATLAWRDLGGHTPDLVPLGSAGFHKMNLDIVEPGKVTEVVTGIQWKLVNHALSLEVGFSVFDGNVAAGPPTFRKATFPPPKAKRDRHELGDTISPIKQQGPSQPYPITDNSKYIEFDASSLEKDGGQAVVPFFDLQAMTSPDGHSRPLRNVGILYKSKAGSGGFITTSAKF